MRPVCTNLLQKLADAHAGFPRDRWRKHGHHFVQQPRLRFHQLGHSLAHNTWQSTCAGQHELAVAVPGGGVLSKVSASAPGTPYHVFGAPQCM